MNKKTLKLLEALRNQWPHPNCAFIAEFRGGTGYERESRADAIAMHLWPSKGLELIGFELKTSRTDWLKELKQSDKCEPIKQFCDRWYLVVDNQIIVREYDGEVPEDWGYMYMSYTGKIEIKKEAPKLKPKAIDRLFLASLMRIASNPHDEIVIDGRKYVIPPT